MIHYATMVLAQAKDAGGDQVLDGLTTFSSVYLAIGGAVVAGLGWLLSLASSRLKGSYSKLVAGRFISLFSTGLRGAHAKFKIELEASKSPNSPGGAAITKAEMELIKEHMWGYLKKTYGNFDSIAKAVSIFTGSRSEDAVKAFVDSKIDAGIAELESGGGLDPSKPAS